MIKKFTITITLAITIASLLFSPALSPIGYGPDAVSGATTYTPKPKPAPSVPNPTTVIPLPSPVKPVVIEPSATTVYTDTPSLWAKEALLQAEQAELTFDHLLSQYNKPITRQEYAELMVNLYESTTGKIIFPSVLQPFADTTSDAVAKAKALGLVSGIGNSLFNPNGTLTRQEAATMMYREWVLTHPGYQLPAQIYKFEDSIKIAPWAEEGIQFMYHNNLIAGTGNNLIDPKGFLTREQAIVLAWNNYVKAESDAATIVDGVSSATNKASKTDATTSATSNWDDDDVDHDDDDHDEWDDD